MALRASLLVAGDTSGAVAALAAADKGMAESEKRAAALAEKFYAADKAIGQLASAQTQAAAETSRTKAAFAAGEITLEQYNRELLETKSALSLVSSQHQSALGEIKKFGTGLQSVHASAGQQKAGLQQLGFQIGDFTTQVSSGTSFAQAFAQQIGQTGQAIQLMGGGASKLSAFLGGGWGIALTVALTALAPLVAKLFEGEDASDKLKGASIDLSNALDRQRAGHEALSKAIDDYNERQKKATETGRLYELQALATARADLQRALATRQALAAQLATALADQEQERRLAIANGSVAVGENIPVSAAEQILGENAKEVLRLQGEINNHALELGGLAGKALDPLEQIRQKYEDIRRVVKDISRGGTYKGTPVQDVLTNLAKAQRADEDRAKALLKGTRPSALDRTTSATFGSPVSGGTITGRFGTARPGHTHGGVDIGVPVGTAVRAVADGIISFAGQKADYGNLVELDTGGAVTRDGHLSRIIVAEGQKIAKGALLGYSGGARGAVGAGNSQGPHVHHEVRVGGKPVDPFGRYGVDAGAVADAEGKRADEAARAYDRLVEAGQHYIDQLKREGEEIGLTAQQQRALNSAREVAKLPTDAQKREANEVFALNEVKQAAFDAAEAVGGALADAFDNLGGKAADFIQQGIGDELEKQANAARSLSDQIGNVAGIMSSLGGTGRSIGGLIGGLNSGDLGRVPGPAGALLGLLGNVKVGEKSNGDIIRLGDRIQAIFKSGGPFAKTMSSILEGTGLGLAAGSAILGGKNSGIGSSVGGALGEVIGKKVLSKGLEKIASGLGEFAGPLGAIAGGILGGLVGGLLKKTKTGTATVGSVNGTGAVTGTGGNSQSRIGAARGLAGTGLDALDRIIESLGGEYGSFSASIGVRNKKFVVDPTGAGRTKGAGTQKFASEEEATKALLADVISDGAVKGISAAVQKALRSSPDVEKALKEALKVQQVELAIGGIGAQLQKAFKDFERQASERLRIGKQYGFDLVKLEERNAKDRLKLSEQLLADQVGSLQRLIDELTGGSLFEGSAVDKRQAILGRIAATKADADAGVEGAADKLSGLLEQLNAVSKDVFATTGGFATDRASILDQARDTIAKANQRITDAQKGSDPALTATNAALDENNDQNAQIIAALNDSNILLGSIAAQGGTVDFAYLSRLAATSGSAIGKI